MACLFEIHCGITLAILPSWGRSSSLTTKHPRWHIHPSAKEVKEQKRQERKQKKLAEKGSIPCRLEVGELFVRLRPSKHAGGSLQLLTF